MNKRYLDSDGFAYAWDKIERRLSDKQDRLTGTAGQVVGFDSAGKAVAQDAAQDAGPFAFSVSGDGHLICSYSGGEPPAYYINGSGHLCLDI